MKTIYYKDYRGEWVKSDLPATQKNLKKIRKEKALNGQADIFDVAPAGFTRQRAFQQLTNFILELEQEYKLPHLQAILNKYQDCVEVAWPEEGVETMMPHEFIELLKVRWEKKDKSGYCIGSTYSGTKFPIRFTLITPM